MWQEEVPRLQLIGVRGDRGADRSVLVKYTGNDVLEEVATLLGT